MGLSLSVLIAIVLLLPGAAFVFATTRLSSPTAPSTGLEQQLSLSLAIALLAAIVAHVCGLVFLQLAVHFSPWIHQPNPTAVVQLLGGNSTSSAEAAPAAIGDHPICIAAYFSLLTAAMWGAGKQANRLLRDRDEADWYRLLKPDGADMVVLTAEVCLGRQVILYKGIVKDFRIGKNGDLERVVLIIAARKPLLANVSEASAEAASILEPKLDSNAGVVVESAAAPNEESLGGQRQQEQSSLGYGWTEIPGEHVVLQMKDAKTINLDYFWTQAPSY